MSVTFSCFEKISGISSTPIFSDFAVTKGDLLKAGSSAIATLSASTAPEKIDKLRLPIVTWRPNAALASASILGRKLFTLIRNGSAINIRTKTATTIDTMRNQRLFIGAFLFSRTYRPDVSTVQNSYPRQCAAHPTSFGAW
jgi:hypothetical protein